MGGCWPWPLTGLGRPVQPGRVPPPADPAGPKQSCLLHPHPPCYTRTHTHALTQHTPHRTHTAPHRTAPHHHHTPPHHTPASSPPAPTSTPRPLTLRLLRPSVRPRQPAQLAHGHGARHLLGPAELQSCQGGLLLSPQGPCRGAAGGAAGGGLMRECECGCVREGFSRLLASPQSCASARRPTPQPGVGVRGLPQWGPSDTCHAATRVQAVWPTQTPAHTVHAQTPQHQHHSAGSPSEDRLTAERDLNMPPAAADTGLMSGRS